MTDKNAGMLPEHQSKMKPEDNKFHVGNGDDKKHYWLTPPEVFNPLNAEFNFDFDPCPFPKPEDFDGLTCEWGVSSYVNPPFGSIMHEGKKKGPTAWARKAITEHKKGKKVVLVYPIDKWVLMLLAAGAKVRNLGDVRWLATEDNSQGKGTGRHIAAFILDETAPPAEAVTDDAREAIEFSKAEKITLDQLEEHLKKGDDEDIVGITSDGAVIRRTVLQSPSKAVDDNLVQNLTILVKRLCAAIRNHTDDDSPAREITGKAMGYLNSQGLSGSPLKSEYTEGSDVLPKDGQDGA